MNVKGLLEDLGIEILTEDRVNYNACCPLHDDSAPSFSVHKENGKWICRAGCGAGKLEKLVSRILGYHEIDAKKYLEKFTDPISDLIDIFRKKLRIFSEPPDAYYVRPPEVPLPKEYRSFSTSKAPAPYQQYLDSRKLNATVIEETEIGWCNSGKYFQRIIIPIYMFDKAVGFLARSIDPNDSKKYLNATNVLFTNLLFGLNDIETGAEVVWLCESSFDCLTLLSWNYPAVSTFGAHLSNRQIGYLLNKSVKKIIICYHNDEAGNTEVTRKLALIQTLFGSVGRLALPENADINEMDHEQFLRCPVTDLSYQDGSIERILGSVKWKMERLKTN